MILYLDTSALIKLYIDEEHSEVVREAVIHSEAVSTHTVTYPETRATLARLHRENRLTDVGLDSVKAAFEADWGRFVRVQATQSLLTRAGVLLIALMEPPMIGIMEPEPGARFGVSEGV